MNTKIRKFVEEFRVRNRIERTSKINVANSNRVVVRKRDSPIVNSFKKVSGSRVVFEEAVLVFGN